MVKSNFTSTTATSTATTCTTATTTAPNVWFHLCFRADELNRRKSREIPSTPTKMSTPSKMLTLKPTPRISPALTSPPKRSCLKTETKVGEVANHPNQRLIDDSDDPSHLLNVWLGELDSLQKVTKKERNRHCNRHWLLAI